MLRFVKVEWEGPNKLPVDESVQVLQLPDHGDQGAGIVTRHHDIWKYRQTEFREKRVHAKDVQRGVQAKEAQAKGIQRKGSIG